MFEACCAEEPDDGANEYRRLLFQKRHTDPRDPAHEVDYMLFMCVNFIQLCKSARVFKNGARKEVLTSMRDLGFGQTEEYGEAGREALYQEIRNAAARYFKTCESSGYNRRLFGLMSSGEDNRKDRMCRDAWQMSEGLAGRTGLQHEMKEWNRGVLDAFAATGGWAADAFQDYCSRMS